MKLDVDKINEKSPYFVNSIGDSYVSFQTDYGVKYYAGFDPDDVSLPEELVWQFAIVNINNKKSPHDSKVRQTIIAIVENFFLQNNEVMLYICETGDGKQSMRNRLFSYWINYHKKNWNISFWSSSVKDENGVVNHATIIVRNDNPRFDKIAEKFADTIQLFNEKPRE